MAHVHYASLKAVDAVTALSRWSVAGRVDLREWDDEFVVRAESTGGTFLLSSLAGHILRAISRGARDIDQIAAEVFGDCGPSNEATASLVATFAESMTDSRSLLGLLVELEELGLAQAEFA